MNDKKYTLHLTQDELDQIVFALVMLKVDTINCLECNVNVDKRNHQLGIVCSLLSECADLEARSLLAECAQQEVGDVNV